MDDQLIFIIFFAYIIFVGLEAYLKILLDSIEAIENDFRIDIGE